MTLTTIHAAKGLEFDVVVCVGLEEGLFPHARALEEGQIEEERRLAYVAFTRAKKQLVLTYASVRGARAATERRSASTFLCELPIELLWDPERARRPEIVPPERPGEPKKPIEREVAVEKKPESRPAKEAAKPAREPLWKRGLTGATSASRSVAGNSSPSVIQS